MPFELWLAYVATSAVILAIPGPTILLVLSYSISRDAARPCRWLPVSRSAIRSRSRCRWSARHLARDLALWFTVIKWLGGLYLIYLGCRLLLSARNPQPMTSTTVTNSSPRKLFGNAFIVTALNPKSIVFFIALLPQFISPAYPATAQLWILGITFVVLATIGAASYALFATSLRRFLASPRAQRGYGLVGGSLLCAAGAWALGARRVVTAS